MPTFILLDAPLFPDKLPENATQLMIWLVIAFVVAGLGLLVVVVRWFVSYLDQMRIDSKELASSFMEQSTEVQQRFIDSSADSRRGHAEAIERVSQAHEAVCEKQLGAFERSMDKLMDKIDGIRCHHPDATGHH